MNDLELLLREAREEIAIQRWCYVVSGVAWKRSGKLLDRIDAALSVISGENDQCYDPECPHCQDDKHES